MTEELRFRDPIDAAGFTILPNLVLLTDALSPRAKLLYAFLRHYARSKDWAFPGQDRLAQHTGVSTRQLRDYIAELVQLQLISVQRRGQGKTNIYWIEPLHVFNSLLQIKADRNSSSGQERNPSSE